MNKTELKPCERCAYYNEDRDNQPCCSCFGQNFEDEKLLINNPKSNNSEDMSNNELIQMYNDLGDIFLEEYEKRRIITPQNTAEKMTAKGYRKQMQEEVKTLYDRIKAMPFDELVSFFVYLSQRGIIETADKYICRKCKADHGGNCPVSDDDLCLYEVNDKETIKLWLGGDAYGA